MRLVFLIGRFPPGVYGGAELQAEGWARRLAKRHALIVVTRKNRPGDPGEETRGTFAWDSVQPRLEAALARWGSA
jgi:hypothetical protein